MSSRSLFSIGGDGTSMSHPMGTAEQPVVLEPTDKPWGEWGTGQARPCPYENHPRWQALHGPQCAICHPPAPGAIAAAAATATPAAAQAALTVACVLCEKPLDPREGYQRAIGWVTVATGGKGFRTQSRPQEFAHRECVERDQKGVSAAQQSML